MPKYVVGYHCYTEYDHYEVPIEVASRAEASIKATKLLRVNPQKYKTGDGCLYGIGEPSPSSLQELTDEKWERYGLKDAAAEPSTA